MKGKIDEALKRLGDLYTITGEDWNLRIPHSIAGANQLSLNRKDLVQRFAMLSTLNDPDTS